MSDNKRPFNDGYIPRKIEKGYQPAESSPTPAGKPTSRRGYTPSNNGGESPTSKPKPPGPE